MPVRAAGAGNREPGAPRGRTESDVMYNLPDDRGHFGPYGGVFVAETLIHALDELRAAYEKFKNDPTSSPNTTVS